jgi:hypothetical protein
VKRTKIDFEMALINSLYALGSWPKFYLKPLAAILGSQYVSGKNSAKSGTIKRNVAELDSLAEPSGKCRSRVLRGNGHGNHASNRLFPYLILYRSSSTGGVNSNAVLQVRYSRTKVS